MKKLIVAFRNSANAPKNQLIYVLVKLRYELKVAKLKRYICVAPSINREIRYTVLPLELVHSNDVKPAGPRTHLTPGFHKVTRANLKIDS